MKRFFIFFLLSLVAACTAPRAVSQSGRVTPKDKFRVGSDYTFNISTQTTAALFDGIKTSIEELLDEEDAVYDDTTRKISKALLAYSIDPLSSGMDFYLRYGVLKNMDMGYKYATGIHVLDGRWQFMQPMTTPQDDASLHGSIGVQYSSQSYDLPSFMKLNKLQSFLGYKMSRKDVLIPLIFSRPFGEEEKYGALGFGLAYNYTKLDYGFEPLKLYNKLGGDVDTEVIAPVHAEKSIHAYGAFFNLKGGYKYVYLTGGLSLYYQDYGEYELLEGDSAKLSGLTIIPTLGLEGEF
jgi:hypothetical protein